MLDFDRNKIRAHNTRSAGHNTTIYTIEFLNSDWLYFLWYDMKKYILFENMGVDRVFAWCMSIGCEILCNILNK